MPPYHLPPSRPKAGLNGQQEPINLDTKFASHILQWNVQGLWANRGDLDILVKHLQPEVICLQETKLEKNPQKAHFQCANCDCYYKSLQRRDDQLPCGRVSIHIKKGIFHKPVQLNTHLQAVAVQVTLQGVPATIFSAYAPSHGHLSVRDLTNLIKTGMVRSLSQETLMVTTIYGAVDMMTPVGKLLSDL